VLLLPAGSLRPVLWTKVGVQIEESAAIYECGSIAGVEITLGWQSFSKDDVVAVEFDMPVFDLIMRHLHDSCPVNELFGLDQDSLLRIECPGLTTGREQASANAPARTQIGQTTLGSGCRAQATARCPSQRTCRASPML
jgi:hypothetical protein